MCVCEYREHTAYVSQGLPFNMFYMAEPDGNRSLSKELIEFFNGAILAVTGNAVHQVHRPRAGISLCRQT